MHPTLKLLGFAIAPLVLSLPIVVLMSDQGGSAIAQESISDKKAEGDRLFKQGNQQYKASQFEAALQSWQQALGFYQQVKDRSAEAQILGNLGVVYQSLGDYAKAIEYQQQRLVITRELKDRLGEGKAIGNLGLAYNALGDYAKATECQQQSLAIARELNDRQGEEYALVNLGLVHQSLGSYTKAIEYQQQSLAIAREIKDRQGEGHALGNLGLAYDALGNYAKAIEYQQQSLAIAREINDQQDEGDSLGNLGLAYAALGNYAKAIEYQQQSLAIAREINDRRGEGTALGNLGNAYQSLGNYAKAIEHQQQHLTIARELNDRRGEENALGNLGNAYQSLGNYAKAIEYQQRGLAIARAINDQQGEGDLLGNLGNAYQSLGNYAKAIESQQQGLAIARAIKDRSGEAMALNNLGVLLLIAENLAGAEKTLMEGIEVAESLRAQLGNNDANKISIFKAQATTYRTLQQVLIAANKPTAALEIAERGRARAFVEQLVRRLQGAATSASLAVQPATLAQMQQIAKSHNATLVQYSIILDDFKIQGKAEFHESDLYIWVIKPTGEVSFHKTDLTPLWQQQNTTLSALVSLGRQAIGARSRSDRADVIVTLTPEGLQRQQEQQNRNLKQLHQMLIDPIADLLPKDPNDRVIFMPQGELFLVPFPALLNAQNQPLITQHTILTAPSIQTLDLTHKAAQSLPKANRPALVVGNPTMPAISTVIGDPPTQLAALPGSETEAIAIAKQLNTQALTGANARKDAIVQQMQKAGIIHLATHGLLDSFKGDTPGAIALAPNGNGDRNDGLLTSGELFDLKLNADLVVLSACDTGRGDITGDGVVGLSRSLFVAGVPSVIISLWKVPDESTAFLMTEFYKNWNDRKLDKAQALRQAMLTTRAKYPQPLDWAAFTLIGEAN